jgi:hypothetical protein
LLERLCPGRLDRQWRADQHVRLEDLVDRLGDEFQIAGVDGIIEASDGGFVACCWSVDMWLFLWSISAFGWLRNTKSVVDRAGLHPR